MTTPEAVPEKPAPKISEETAEQQFQLFLDAYGIDFSDSEDQTTIKQIKKKIIRAIMTGIIEITDGDELLVSQRMQYTEAKSTFTYHEITGKTKKILDKYEQGKPYTRAHALLAALSKQPEHEFSNLRRIDNSIAECLSWLFLQA